MIAVADTSPLCYLVLTDEVDLLRKLLSQVVIPSAVMTELLHEDAPEAVRAWAANLPSWVAVQDSLGRVSFSRETSTPDLQM